MALDGARGIDDWFDPAMAISSDSSPPSAQMVGRRAPERPRPNIRVTRCKVAVDPDPASSDAVQW